MQDEVKDLPGREDIQYWAALLDGEGTVTVFIQGDEYIRPKVGISSSTLPVLEEFMSIFGGCIVTKKRYNLKHKPAYTAWLDGKKNCEPFLRQVLPYLKIKKAQAELVLMIIDNMGKPGKVISIEDKVFRFKILEKIREVNKRGA